MTAADAGFLAEIIARPGDDAPRLVYADWLDDHGDPARAEFIRAQVELARLPAVCPACYAGGGGAALDIDCLRCENAAALRRRERELWRERWRKGDFPLDAATALAWNYLLPGDSPPNLAPAAVYRRGFVEAVTLPCADWLAHGPAVVRAQPVTCVTLGDKQPEPSGGPIRSLERWYWYPGEVGSSSSQIPPEFWRRLRGDNPAGCYTSRETALADLSAAALAWARGA